MKKILVFLGILLLVTGCSLTSREDKEKTFKLDNYGSFSINEDCMIRYDHSTHDKLFFVDKKDEHSDRPNNISTNGGTNYYSINQVDEFKEAIMRQMAMQAKAYNAILTSSGTTSNNGYPVLRFNMEGKEQKTIQYYIMGEKKYMLVHVTIFDLKEEDKILEEAEYIVNTFTWEE